MLDEVSIVLADDHPIVLDGLRNLLVGVGGFRIQATCQNGREVVETVEEFKPDILCLDLNMPGMGGIEILRALRKGGLETKVVILTASLDESEVTEALKLGVKGVVLKEMASSLLVNCLRKVGAGGQWFERQSMGRALERLLHREEGEKCAAALLTTREIEVVKMAARGLRNLEIADRLNLSEGTIKVHLHNIYEKLGVTGRMALLVWARERGLE